MKKLEADSDASIPCLAFGKEVFVKYQVNIGESGSLGEKRGFFFFKKKKKKTPKQ